MTASVCPTCGATLASGASAAGLCPRCLLATALSEDERDETFTLLPPGTVVGPFTVVRLLGRGGMAAVYEAQDPLLDRAIALKLLPPQFLHDKTFARRFEREARVIAKLEHPNIVPIYSTGIDDGTPWMSMRLLGGGNLSATVERRPRPADVVRMLREVALALDYAHGHGIVHRDIKPTNLLLDDSGRVSVSDFGLAQILGADIAQTSSGMFAGTPHYMAPEQALGKPLDHRCDIYSLGIVAYELFTGETPFTAESPVAILFKQVNEAIPVPSVDSVPAAVMDAIRRAVAKEPSARFASASDFVDALEQAIAADVPGRPAAARRRRSMAAGAALITAGSIAWFLVRTAHRDAPPLENRAAETRQIPEVVPPEARPPATEISATPSTVLTSPAVRAQPRQVAPPREDIPARPNSPPQIVPLARAIAPEPLPSPAAVSADEPVRNDVAPPSVAADVATGPVLVRKVDPTYPTMAKAAQLEGDVILQVVVGTDGQVSGVTVVKSVHPLLDDAAKKAVLRYQYRPGQRNGVPEPTTIRIAVSFRMR